MNSFKPLDTRFVSHSKGLAKAAMLSIAIVCAGCNSKDGNPVTPVIPRDTLDGIPAEWMPVKGLTAAYDTAAGTVRLNWNRVLAADVAEYRVYRDGEPAFSQTHSPLLVTQDTFAVDTVFRRDARGGEFSFEDSNSHFFEYRIRARDRSGRMGMSSDSRSLLAATPTLVRTYIEFTSAGGQMDSASIGDTVTISARYRNQGRRNRLLHWLVDGRDSVLREVQVDAFAGTDEVSFAWDRKAQGKVSLRITDEGGQTWEKTRSVSIVEDPPSADAGRDSILTIQQPLQLRGKGKDVFGSIVKWEWDIGNTGRFLATRGPDTTFTPKVPSSAFQCVLRVTDDDGWQGLDTVQYRLVAWRRHFSWSSNQLGFMDGKIYALEPGSMMKWDPDLLKPVSLSTPPFGSSDARVFYAPDRVYQYSYSGIAWYTPASDNWVFGPMGDGLAPGHRWEDNSIFLLGNRLMNWVPPGKAGSAPYLQAFHSGLGQWDKGPGLGAAFHPDDKANVFSGIEHVFVFQEIYDGFSFNRLPGPVHFYHPPSEKWRSSPILPTRRARFLGEGSGRLYVAGLDGYFTLDLSTNQWTRRAVPPFNPENVVLSQSLGSNLVVVARTVVQGAKDGGIPQPFSLHVYDSTKDEWATKFPLIGIREPANIYLFGKRVFYFGNEGAQSALKPFLYEHLVDLGAED